uniref:Uncharacterized protein n=1 Tax=Leersia perrieri TaxID=77586 RepID=A0A0D9WSL0_9ORYZ
MAVPSLSMSMASNALCTAASSPAAAGSQSRVSMLTHLDIWKLACGLLLGFGQQSLHYQGEKGFLISSSRSRSTSLHDTGAVIPSILYRVIWASNTLKASGTYCKFTVEITDGYFRSKDNNSKESQAGIMRSNLDGLDIGIACATLQRRA